MAVEVIFVL